LALSESHGVSSPFPSSAEGPRGLVEIPRSHHKFDYLPCLRGTWWSCERGQALLQFPLDGPNLCRGGSHRSGAGASSMRTVCESDSGFCSAAQVGLSGISGDSLFSNVHGRPRDRVGVRDITLIPECERFSAARTALGQEDIILSS